MSRGTGTGRQGRQSLAAIFLAPTLIAIASTIGLIAALTGDGLRDLVSWITLGIPVLVVAWALWARRS
ncbi:hypothetical protein [Niveispirillum fermenti]|uniref:hypothetical protein n=1 Tax=Niveispirillum fermenti TaxID=1233113 RepID=UPI003A8A89BF